MPTVLSSNTDVGSKNWFDCMSLTAQNFDDWKLKQRKICELTE